MPRLRLHKLSLLGKFSVLSLVAMVAMAIALAEVLTAQIERRALANAESTADALGQMAARPLLSAAELRDGIAPARLAEIQRALRVDLGHHTIEKARVYSGDLQIVYSDDRAEVGRTAEPGGELLDARAGEITSEIEEHAEHSGMDGQLLEVYVPLRLDPAARPAGVLELHLPYGPTAAAIERDKRTLYAALAGGLALLWMLLFRIVAGASKRLRRQAEENRHQALHDALTGLPNRTLLYERMGRALEARRGDRVDVLLIIDLDRFKEVNDTLGHDHGDLLLREVAGRLAETVRGSDTLARLGGDEFALFAPAVSDRDAAAELAMRIQRALDRPFMLRGLTVELEASIGIALRPDHGTDVNTLVQRADVAMYEAKRGRTRIETYSPERDPYTATRLALMGELRGAIERDELVLHYQPVIDLPSGRVTGVEALVRWQHPHWGLIPPNEFIPLAERTGAIGSLTAWVVDRALRQWRTWTDDGLDLTMAVNLAGPNVVDADVPEAVAAALDRHRVPPDRLRLEISESTVMADPHRAREVLDRFRALGVGLSLDDFGTGYASLAYLKRLPLDELKIDRSFVMSMGEDRNDAAIVRSTIDLARSLGLAAIAEGVETAAARDELTSLGCPRAQGFLFSKPLPPEELRARLGQSARAGEGTRLDAPALRAV